MNATKLFAISALAAASFGVWADEADGSQFASRIQSARSTAEVKAEARNPVKITNGGTGFVGVTQSGTSAATVKAQAVQSARAGLTSRGEM